VLDDVAAGALVGLLAAGGWRHLRDHVRSRQELIELPLRRVGLEGAQVFLARQRKRYF
jgi:hypothetical protein